MTGTLGELARDALAELRTVFDRLPDDAGDRLIEAILRARRIALHGVGREGLQMRGFAMRLFHLGRNAHVVGDMTTPPLADGDLLIASAGAGGLPTVEALMMVARDASARVALVTAQSGGSAARLADLVTVIPAQTMADDQGATGPVLPMGSLFEAAQMLFFELVILKLRERLGGTARSMRARHTNLE
jgi:6-phospho-3-hexuloisomerase